MQKKTKKITLDDLAAMVATGFDSTATKKDITDLKTDFADLKADVGTLQTDVSDIKLRLDNLAPKFEVRDLERRVTRLEDKTGIRHTIQH